MQVFLIKKSSLLSIFFIVSSFCACGYSKVEINEYVQTECTYDPKYVYIEFFNGERKRGFIFDTNGIAFRVWPMYYAKHYRDIIGMKYLEIVQAKSNAISLAIKEEDETYEEPLGMIKVDCFDKLGHFLKKHGIDLPVLGE